MITKSYALLISLSLCTMSISGMQQTTQPQNPSLIKTPVINQSTQPQAQSITPQFIAHHHGYLLDSYSKLLNDPNYIDPLTYAIQKKNSRYIRDLFTNYFDDTYALVTLFIQHAKLDLLQQLLTLVNEKNIPWDLNRVPPNSLSLLDLALQYLHFNKTNPNNLKIVRLLLRYGASIEPYVIQNKISLVKLLIKNGARLNIPAHGLLLLKAIRQNLIPMTELLLNYDAIWLTQDNYGRTLIHEPLIQGNVQMVQLLRKYNVPPFVSKSLQEKLVRTVEKNAKVAEIKELFNAMPNDKEQALMQAVEDEERAKANEEKQTVKMLKHTIKTLLAERLNGYAINENGEYLLTIAARNENQAMIRILVHFGKANLRYLVESGDYKTVAYVLACVPCHISREEAQWLLTRAKALQDDNMIKILQEYNINMEKYDREGTPLPEKITAINIKSLLPPINPPKKINPKEISEVFKACSKIPSETKLPNPTPLASVSQSTSSVSSNSSSSQTSQTTPSTTTNQNAALVRHHRLRPSVDYDNLAAFLPTHVS